MKDVTEKMHKAFMRISEIGVLIIMLCLIWIYLPPYTHTEHGEIKPDFNESRITQGENITLILEYIPNDSIEYVEVRPYLNITYKINETLNETKPIRLHNQTKGTCNSCGDTPTTTIQTTTSTTSTSTSITSTTTTTIIELSEFPFLR